MIEQVPLMLWGLTGEALAIIGSAIVATMGLLVLVTAFSCWFIVSEGHVGIVKRFSEAKYQTGPGFHFKAPWIDSVEKTEIRQRKSVEKLAGALARNPVLVDYKKAERWDGVLPRMMLGNKAGFLLQLPKPE